MLRASRLLIPLSIAALGVACTSESNIEFKTSGGHLLDDRGWAVGSAISISAGSPMMGAARVGFESDDGVISENDPGYGGGFMLPPLFPGMNEYRYAYGTVEAEGDFDIVVQNGSGSEIARVSSSASEIDDYALGVALDDCPEFADFVFDRDATPAVLEGSLLTFTPAPLDAEGNPLVGAVEVTWETDLPGWEDEWGYASEGMFLTVEVGEAGTITMTIDDEVHEFEILTVPQDELAELQILSMPEKHGEVERSLLSVVATTEDGRIVHGLTPTWSSGALGQTVHADNNSSVEACFGDLCATWEGTD
jgi:hypothetical protein